MSNHLGTPPHVTTHSHEPAFGFDGGSEGIGARACLTAHKRLGDACPGHRAVGFGRPHNTCDHQYMNPTHNRLMQLLRQHSRRLCGGTNASHVQNEADAQRACPRCQTSAAHHGDDAEPFVEVGSRRTIAANVPLCELLHCLSAVWRVD